MIFFIRIILFCCYGCLLLGAQGIDSLLPEQACHLGLAEAQEDSSLNAGPRIQPVEFAALKALTESSVLGTSVPPAPFLKRTVEGHETALGHKAIVVTTSLRQGFERAISIRQQFGAPDLIFPFHYFP